MLLRVGSRGQEVKDLQEFLNIGADGIFGEGTKKAVQEFQKANGLVADGIVGPSTWDTMGLATTDDTEKTFTTENGLVVNRHYLPVGEYKSGITKKNIVSYITPQDGRIHTELLTIGVEIVEEQSQLSLY